MSGSKAKEKKEIIVVPVRCEITYRGVPKKRAMEMLKRHLTNRDCGCGAGSDGYYSARILKVDGEYEQL